MLKIILSQAFTGLLFSCNEKVVEKTAASLMKEVVSNPPNNKNELVVYIPSKSEKKVLVRHILTEVPKEYAKTLTERGIPEEKHLPAYYSFLKQNESSLRFMGYKNQVPQASKEEKEIAEDMAKKAEMDQALKAIKIHTKHYKKWAAKRIADTFVLTSRKWSKYTPEIRSHQPEYWEKIKKRLNDEVSKNFNSIKQIYANITSPSEELQTVFAETLQHHQLNLDSIKRFQFEAK